MDKSDIIWYVLISVGVWVGLLPAVPEARRAYKAHLVALVRWFWGHRSTYSLFEGDNKEIKIQTSNLKLRSDSSRYRHNAHGPVLEVNHGFWRRRSAIYGSGWRWKIWRTNYSRKKSAGEFVHLFDVWGLTPQAALRLVNQYESLEGMTDKITSLTEALNEANRNNRELWAGLTALIIRMEMDKQRYKSPPAAHMKECVRRILEWASDNLGDHVGSRPTSEMEGVWLLYRFPPPIPAPAGKK